MKFYCLFIVIFSVISSSEANDHLCLINPKQSDKKTNPDIATYAGNMLNLTQICTQTDLMINSIDDCSFGFSVYDEKV